MKIPVAGSSLGSGSLLLRRRSGSDGVRRGAGSYSAALLLLRLGEQLHAELRGSGPTR